MRSVLLVAGLTLLGGCLTNLNEQKYFDKLERHDARVANLVRANQAKIESAIDAALGAQALQTIDEVTHWGAGWDAVNRVHGKQGELFMRGRVFFEAGPASTYWVSYRVTPSDEVEVIEAKLFGLAARGSS